MSRPAGVTVSAVFLILGCVLTILMGVLMVLANSIVPSATPQQPLAKAMMVFMAVVFFGFALWGLLTAVGLLRMRRWARISILVIGVLLVFICGLSLAMILFVTQQMPEIESTGRTGSIIGIMLGVYLIPILLGLLWLIYFNRAAVKGAFLEGALAPTGHVRPLSIAVIAWHLVAFGLLTPIALWFHSPALVLGMLWKGWAAAFVYCVFTVLQLAIGVGLLRLKPWSRNAAIWFCILGMVNSIAFALVPNARGKMITAMKEISPYFSEAASSVQLPDPILNAAGGVMFMALPLFYLITRGQAFLEAGSKSDIAK